MLSWKWKIICKSRQLRYPIQNCTKGEKGAENVTFWSCHILKFTSRKWSSLDPCTENESMNILPTWSRFERLFGSWLRAWYWPRSLSPAAILLNFLRSTTYKALQKWIVFGGPCCSWIFTFPQWWGIVMGLTLYIPGSNNKESFHKFSPNVQHCFQGVWSLLWYRQDPYPRRVTSSFSKIPWKSWLYKATTARKTVCSFCYVTNELIRSG